MSKKPLAALLRTSVIVGALGFALTGCASQIMTCYVGQTLAQPILDYGPPSTAYDMGDGRRAFVWVMRQQSVIPGYTTTTAIASAHGSHGYASGNLLSTTLVMAPGQREPHTTINAIDARERRPMRVNDAMAAWYPLEVPGLREALADETRQGAEIV